MTRVELRTLLRRQLGDPAVGTSGVQWTDAELNTIIEQAYFLIQLKVFGYDRNAHLSWDTIDTVVDQSAYALPSTFGIRRIGLKASASDTKYTKLKPASYEDIVDSTSTTRQYARMGQFIHIFPAPTVAVTDGIQLIHTPIMSMSADTDVPKVKEPLHIGIVWMGVVIASDEDETRDLTEIKAKLQDLIDSIPQWYSLDSDDNDRLQPIRL